MRSIWSKSQKRVHKAKWNAIIRTLTSRKAVSMSSRSDGNKPLSMADWAIDAIRLINALSEHDAPTLSSILFSTLNSDPGRFRQIMGKLQQLLTMMTVVSSNEANDEERSA